jgi:MoxR-like ATPase
MKAYTDVKDEMKKHIAGKEETIELLFIALVADGHALLEGVPGVAKTTMTKALASTVDAKFARLQGTPDLEPRDIYGYTYVDTDNSVKFKPGPVFTNILLVDELNRSQPKTMSALLETLEEKQVTAGGSTMPLPKPFTAYATQNPLNIEGTVALPKVLADRFLIKIDVTYPSQKEEQEMIRMKEKEERIETKKIIGIEQVLELQRAATGVSISDDVLEYITSIVSATRTDIHVVMGASPRADISFMKAGKAKALIEGRNEVTRDDIKFLAKPVLSHRISVRSTGGVGVNGIINGIVATLR